MTHRGRLRERGSAIIEFSLAFPFLVAVMTGIFTWAYTFYTYNALFNNVRSGARYMAQQSYVPNTANGQPAACLVADVQNMVVYGKRAPAAGDSPVLPGLTPANVSVSATLDAGLVPQTVTIAIATSQPYTLALSWISFKGKPSITFPYTGIYSPEATTCQ
jgi:Flp pilus assembly protein TadG